MVAHSPLATTFAPRLLKPSYSLACVAIEKLSVVSGVQIQSQRRESEFMESINEIERYIL